MTLVCSPKVTHHHDHLGGVLPPGKSVVLPRGNCSVQGLSLSTPAVESPAPTDSFSCDLSALRALGADDVKPPRTPAAWMILRVPSLIPFLALVTSNERCWVISAKRRSRAP